MKTLKIFESREYFQMTILLTLHGENNMDGSIQQYKILKFIQYRKQKNNVSVVLAKALESYQDVLNDVGIKTTSHLE